MEIAGRVGERVEGSGGLGMASLRRWRSPGGGACQQSRRAVWQHWQGFIIINAATVINAVEEAVKGGKGGALPLAWWLARVMCSSEMTAMNMQEVTSM